MAEPFAGVDLNNYEGGSASTNDSAPEQVSEQRSDVQATAPSTQTTAQQIADLDKLERVRLGGKELPAKELRDSYMRHSDYTKKTKELAENRKYADNFAADFMAIVRDPRLVTEFKKIYPSEYHSMVDSYLKEQGLGQAQSVDGQSQGQGGNDELSRLLAEKLKPYEEKFQRLDAWEQNVKEQETRAIGEQLDALHERFGAKYPFADPDLVDFRVQLAKEKGVEISKDNLAQVYEQVYKGLHEAQQSRLTAQQKAKVTEQVKAGRAAKDVGGGVGIPGAPPKKYSKIGDITKDALAAFGGK